MSRKLPRKWINRGALVLGIIVFPLALQAVQAAFFAPNLPGYLKHAPAGRFDDLDWGALSHGSYDQAGKPQIAAAIRSQEGKTVRLSGYLVPLHTPTQSAHFFMAQNPRGCWFCNPPTQSEVVQVNVAGGKELALCDYPVDVYGRLRVAHGLPTDEALYSIDDAKLVLGN